MCKVLNLVVHSVLAVSALWLSGCAYSKNGCIEATRTDVKTIQNIIDKSDGMAHLDDYQGIALLTFMKGGAFGFGVFGATAATYVKNPETKAYGPPVFSNFGGPSVGIGYAGLDVVDCLILFKDYKDAITFASSNVIWNFTNEASFLAWGAKQMTVHGGNSFSDGAGLSVGFVEGEVFFGGSRDTAHTNLYGSKAVKSILLGENGVPPELKEVINQLNHVMKN